MKNPNEKLFVNMAKAMVASFSGKADEWDESMDEEDKANAIKAAKAGYEVVVSHENESETPGVVSKSDRIKQIEESLKGAKPFYAR